MKIVNKRKFLRTIIVLGIILFLLFFCLTSTYSKSTNKFKEEYISEGDTLWQIAQRELNNNKYYENKEIRNIVQELKKINNLENANLKVGQKIIIPTF